MNINKIKTYLGFAIRGRKIIFGYDNIIISKKKQFLILVSSTVNEKIKEKINNFGHRNSIHTINLDESFELIIGRENCKIVSLLDENLARAIINEIE